MPLTSGDFFFQVLRVLLVLLLYLTDLYRLVLVQIQAAARQLHYIWLQFQIGSSLIWVTLVNV